MIFFDIKDGQVCDLYKKLDIYEDRIPNGFLPIASDPGGNLFLLVLIEDVNGSVFFWGS
jgi:hypothetical protein